MNATSTSTTMADMLESLASLTQELNPTRDFDILYRAKEVMDEREQTRQDEHDKMQTNLKTLAKQLEQAKIAATRPPGAMTATDHSKRMSELEAARHAMIKNITSAEDALSEREATLKALNDEERKLRSTDVAAEHQLDSTTLKIELIRGMGFEPVWTKDGSLSKIIVRSLVSEEIHVVPVDNSMSQDERTDLLWKHAAA